MKTGRSKAVAAAAIDPEIMAQLKAAADLPDDAIDTADPDAPEIPDWTAAVRGKFYRPVKELRSLRIDADVLRYFQAQGPGYQTRINRTLRAGMLRGLRRAARQS